MAWSDELRLRCTTERSTAKRCSSAQSTTMLCNTASMRGAAAQLGSPRRISAQCGSRQSADTVRINTTMRRNTCQCEALQHNWDHRDAFQPIAGRGKALQHCADQGKALQFSSVHDNVPQLNPKSPQCVVSSARFTTMRRNTVSARGAAAQSGSPQRISAQRISRQSAATLLGSQRCAATPRGTKHRRACGLAVKDL